MLASLYDHDDTDEGNTRDNGVSMQHVKARGERVIRAFDDLYCQQGLFDACLSKKALDDREDDDEKEIEELSQSKAECMASQIRVIFLKTGYMHHKNYRLLSPTLSCSCFSNVQFLRGHYPWELDHIKISGLGLYIKLPVPLTDNDIFSVQKQFCLHEQPLLQWWQTQSRKLQWSKISQEGLQFFNLRRQTGEKYWSSDRAVIRDTISLFRSAPENAPAEYGLIRSSKGTLESCRLPRHLFAVPSWSDGKTSFTAIFDTMAIALALMKEQGIPYYATITKGTEFSWVHIDWRLPCREQAFLELYSWPENAANRPWHRLFSNDLLPFISHMLTSLGFVIQEV